MHQSVAIHSALLRCHPISVTYNTYDHKVDRSLGMILSKKAKHRKKKQQQLKLLAATLSRVSNQKVIPTSTVRHSIEMSYLGCHAFVPLEDTV